MRRCTILILVLMILALRGSARSQGPGNFYERSLAAISTPVLHPREHQGETYPPGKRSVHLQIEDPRFHRPPWGGRSADPKKVGLGLTIAGTAVGALGAVIIIANANKPDRVGPGGLSKGHHVEYDIIGGLLILLGVGMLIPGIIMLFKN